MPSTFGNLRTNLLVNQLLSRVTPLNLGLAESEGELFFTAGENATNHVISAHESREGTIRVPVQTLDSVLDGNCPAFIKIDVEGFETPVLAGAHKTLANPGLHSVIMELNGSGERYGYDEKKILATMLAFGFLTYDYDPFGRKLHSLEGKNASSGNTLFVRNAEHIQSLLAEAPRRAVHSIQF